MEVLVIMCDGLWQWWRIIWHDGTSGIKLLRLLMTIAEMLCVTLLQTQGNNSFQLRKGKFIRKHNLHEETCSLGFIEAVDQWKLKDATPLTPPSAWAELYFQMKTTYYAWSQRTRKIQLHSDAVKGVKGEIVQPPHKHLSPAVVNSTEKRESTACMRKIPDWE